MSAERLFAVKEEMEKAEARRLQPYFVRSFFLKAFEQLGGSIHPREAGRFEITHVPASIRERDRRITGRNRREQEPVLKRYERVCFTKEAVQPLDKPGLARAVLMHPGHPLMLAVSDLLLEQHANLLRQGAILVDPADDGDEPWLLFLLTHEVKSGDGQVLSKRLQFVRVNPDGSASFAGWAPHLDLEPLAEAERSARSRTCSPPRGFAPTRSSGPSPSPPPRSSRSTSGKSPSAASPMSTRRSPPFTNGSPRKSPSGPTAGSSSRTTRRPARTCGSTSKMPAAPSPTSKAAWKTGRRNSSRCGTSSTARRSSSAVRSSFRPA